MNTMMQNDEIRMTNDELSPNDEIRNGAEIVSHFCRSGFVILSSFVVRHLNDLSALTSIRAKK
jgi:hypothetical protein